MLIDPSETKWKNVCILHLVKSQNLFLSHIVKNNTSVLALIMFYETRGDNPKKCFRLLGALQLVTLKV